MNNSDHPFSSQDLFVAPEPLSELRPWHGAVNRSTMLMQMTSLLLRHVPNIRNGAPVSLNMLKKILAFLEKKRAENSPNQQVYKLCLQSDLEVLANALGVCQQMQPAEARQYLKMQLDLLPSEREIVEKANERHRQTKPAVSSASQMHNPSFAVMNQQVQSRISQAGNSNMPPYTNITSEQINRAAAQNHMLQNMHRNNQLGVFTDSNMAPNANLGMTTSRQTVSIPAQASTSNAAPARVPNMPIFDSVKKLARKPVHLSGQLLPPKEQEAFKELAARLVYNLKSLLRLVLPLEKSPKFSSQQKIQAYKRILVFQDYAVAVVNGLRSQPPTFMLSLVQVNALVQQIASLTTTLGANIGVSDAAKPAGGLLVQPTQKRTPSPSVVKSGHVSGSSQSPNVAPPLAKTSKNVFGLLEKVYSEEKKQNPPTKGSVPLFIPAASHRLGMRKLAYMSLQDMEIDPSVTSMQQKAEERQLQTVISKCAAELAANARSAKPVDSQKAVVMLSEILPRIDQSALWNEAFDFTGKEAFFPSLIEPAISNRASFENLVNANIIKN